MCVLGRQALVGHAWDCLCPSLSVSTLPRMAGCTRVGSSLCVWQLPALAGGTKAAGSEAQAVVRTVPERAPSGQDRRNIFLLRALISVLLLSLSPPYV